MERAVAHQINIEVNPSMESKDFSGIDVWWTAQARRKLT